MTRQRLGDHGTVLVLALGLVVVVLMGVVVLVTASAAFLQRRALVTVADAAAISGAQAIDLDAYYRDGATAATALDRSAVPGRVRGLLDQFGRDLPEGMVVEEVSSDGHRVRVVLSAPLRLPLVQDWLTARVAVASEAELAYRQSAD